jgi:signal peptidase I
MITMQPLSSSQGRRTWVAIVLALFSPWLGLLYLGRGRRAVFYLLAQLVGLIVPPILAVSGIWSGGVSPVAVVEVISIVGIIDCYRIARRAGASFRASWFTRWLSLLVAALLFAAAVMAVRGFLIEPYRMPSGSMLPTLRLGDIMVVNKAGYGLRMPFVHSLLFGGGGPRRGDVIVFRYPFDTRQYYVKRVIGLPGDKVEYRARRLRLNGELVQDRPVENYVEPSRDQTLLQFEEQLDKASYLVIYRQEDPEPAIPANEHTDPRACVYEAGGVSCTVPPASYFVMGDNH